MVSITKPIRNTAIKVLITGGVIVGVILVAQRFGIGGRVIEGLGGLGGVLTQGPLEFLKVFAAGAGQIGEEAVKISENFQRALSGGLLASEQTLFGGGGFVGGTVTPETILTIPGGDPLPQFLREAFTAFTPQPSPTTPDRPAGQSILDVAGAFTRRAQEFRLAGGGLTQISGSQLTPLERETALQLAVAKSREQFSEFFKLPGEITSRISQIAGGVTSGGFTQLLDEQGRPIRSF